MKKQEDLTLFWNRKPGVFVNKNTGQAIELGGLNIGPQFTGSVREWYETFVETLIDCRNQLHRAAGKNSRAINVYVSPDVRCILESTILFKPNLDKVGPKTQVGTLCGMNVFESRKVDRFEARVEFKTATSTGHGKVIILED